MFVDLVSRLKVRYGVVISVMKAYIVLVYFI